MLWRYLPLDELKMLSSTTINNRHHHLRKLFYTYRIGHLSVADKMAETKTVSFPFMRNLIGMEVDDDSMKAIPYAKVWHIP